MTVPTCGTPHYDYSESLCTEPAGHYIRDRDPHAAPLIIDGRQCGGLAWDEPEPPVTDRHTVNSITSDALDELYADLDQARQHAAAIAARIQALADEYPAGIDTALIHEALDTTAAPAATEATEREKTTRVFAALHRSAEQDVNRVIALYEQWVKAGPPPLGVSLARWWDACLAELHDAILPPMREQRERPTHADGTSYSYAEIRAEGWGYCEGCRMWSTGTPDPHQCPETHMRLATNQPKEK